MTAQQRAQFKSLMEKRWVFKLMCITVAVPVVWGAFSPLLWLARGMQ